MSQSSFILLWADPREEVATKVCLNVSSHVYISPNLLQGLSSQEESYLKLPGDGNFLPSLLEKGISLKIN